MRAPRRGAAFRAMAMILLLWTGARIWLIDYKVPLPSEKQSYRSGTGPAARTKVEPAPREEKLAAGSVRARPLLPEVMRSASSRSHLEAHGPAPLATPLPFGEVAVIERRSPSVPTPLPPYRAEQPGPAPQKGQGRWLAYSYIHWRPGGSGGGSASFPTYGGSQMFARLTYRFGRDPDDSRVAAYIRHSGALDYPDDSEQALGVELQPIAGFPIRLHGERRVRRDRPGATALFASGGGRVEGLPFGSRLSVYGQAGALVDGPDGVLPFYDGQAEWTKAIAEIGSARIRAGTKLSGGGQGRDGRLDIGPMVVGDIGWDNRQLRLEAGWRERVAGNAEPGGGPAVTFSAAF